MTTLALLICLLAATPSADGRQSLLSDIRASIGQVFQDKAVCHRMAERFKAADISSDPLLTGYQGAVRMAEARHSDGVLRKMSLFSEGRSMLEQSIAREPDNVELRFLRLTIQTNVPAILMYSSDRHSDAAFVEREAARLPDEKFRQNVKIFLEKARTEGRL